MIVTRIMALLIGYVFGLFPSGVLVGKSKGIDIRKHGSGNTGATNTLRILGWAAAAVTFIGDSAKSILAIVLVNFLFQDSGYDMDIIGLYAGVGAVLGHNFPVYNKFKGGKGIACTAGVCFALFPATVPVCLTVFALCIALSKYVSLGSIMMAIVLMTQILVFNFYGILDIADSVILEFDILVFFLCIMAIFQHRENIVRLVKGTENKVGQKVEVK